MVPGASPNKHPSILYRLSAAVGVKITLLVFPLTARIIGSRHGGSPESDGGFRELSPINFRAEALTGACVKATAR